MIALAILLCGLFLLIKGRTPVYGGQIAEGKFVRLFGILLILLSVVSFVPLGTLGWIIFGFDILSMFLFYFLAKGRRPTREEEKDNVFSSKEEEKEGLRGFGKAIIILAITFSVLLGGIFLLLLVLKKAS